MKRGLGPVAVGAVLFSSLSGCGGGSGGNGGPGGSPTPTPTIDGPVVAPVIAPLPQINPVTVAQLPNAVANRLAGTRLVIREFDPNAPDTPPTRISGAAAIGKSETATEYRVTNVSAALDEIVSPNRLLIPFFQQDSPNSTPTGSPPPLLRVATAGQLGFTPAQLARYKQVLREEKLVQNGDILKFADFIRDNIRYETVSVFTPNDDELKFNSVTFATPGAVETPEVTGGNRETAFQRVLRNPLDGHTHYKITLRARYKYDVAGVVSITEKENEVELGPFVKERVVAPTVTTVRDNGNPPFSEHVSSSGTFNFDNKGNNDSSDDSWMKLEQLLVKVRDRFVTGTVGRGR